MMENNYQTTARCVNAYGQNTLNAGTTYKGYFIRADGSRTNNYSKASSFVTTAKNKTVTANKFRFVPTN